MMKLKKTLFAIATGCVSLSVYAADQVVREETTPPGPEGAVMVNQIPPVYSPPAPQKAPAPQTETQQPVMPSISTTQTPAQPAQNVATTPQQPAAPQQQSATAQPAVPGQAPETTQGTLPQSAFPNPSVQSPPQQPSGVQMPQQPN